MFRVVVSAPRGNALHAVRRGDEIFLDLCDELGILVLEENHARGLSLEQMQNPRFEAQAEQVIREMIAAHYKGVFDEYRRLKLCAEVVKKIFRET